jgi:nitroreductase
MDDLRKAIFETRRSIRSFEPRQISNVDLHEMLEAAQLAASAMNEQAWFFTVIQKEEVIQELALLATGIEEAPYYNAPTVIACFAAENAIAPVEDCTLAIANMMYAAVLNDLGTCWIHSTKEVFNNPKYAKLKKACGVPDGYTCIGSLAVGYPRNESPKPESRKQNVFSIIR